MTNQEAIEILKRFQEPEAWEPQITSEAYEALGMGINSLQKNIKLLDYVKRKCYEILAEKHNYESIKHNFIYQADKIKNGIRTNDIYEEAINLRVEQEELDVLIYDISRLCHILGGEYLKMWKEIVQNNKDK